MANTVADELTTRKLSVLLRSMDEAVLETDSAGVVVACNRAACLLFACSEDDLLGSHAETILYEEPEDRRISLSEQRDKGLFRAVSRSKTVA